MGRITRFAYDRLSRLVAVVLPNPATGANPPLVDGNSPEAGVLVTRYAYDEQGNKISQTDAEGRVTRWTFDGMGRQRSRVLPMGQQEQFEYDAGGQPSAHPQRRGQVYVRQAKLGRMGSHRREALTEIAQGAQRVRTPPGKVWPPTRKRVLRGVRVTGAAKRRQRGRGPCD